MKHPLRTMNIHRKSDGNLVDVAISVNFKIQQIYFSHCFRVKLQASLDNPKIKGQGETIITQYLV